MKSILVVDDNDMNRELMETVLRGNGYNVLSTDNGTTALEIAKSIQPDLVLMDIQMPFVDGYAALAMLQETASTSAIPVVAVTGNAMPHDTDKILASGFVQCITKPYKLNHLLSVVRSIFDTDT